MQIAHWHRSWLFNVTMNKATANPLSVAEREARLARMVAKGEISAERAKLIDFREPTAKERAFAETLVPAARRALARRQTKAA